jgi:hypothetical protein
VGLIDQFLEIHSTPTGPFLSQIGAQSWSFVVLNSLAKVNKNKAIFFERQEMSLKRFVGPFGLGKWSRQQLPSVIKTYHTVEVGICV